MMEDIAGGKAGNAFGMRDIAPGMQDIAFGMQGIVTVLQTERQEGRLKSGGCYFLWREERSDGENIRMNRTIGERYSTRCLLSYTCSSTDWTALPLAEVYSLAS